MKFGKMLTRMGYCVWSARKHTHTRYFRAIQYYVIFIEKWKNVSELKQQSERKKVFRFRIVPNPLIHCVWLNRIVRFIYYLLRLHLNSKRIHFKHPPEKCVDHSIVVFSHIDSIQIQYISMQLNSIVFHMPSVLSYSTVCLLCDNRTMCKPKIRASL